MKNSEYKKLLERLEKDNGHTRALPKTDTTIEPKRERKSISPFSPAPGDDISWYVIDPQNITAYDAEPREYEIKSPPATLSASVFKTTQEMFKDKEYGFMLYRPIDDILSSEKTPTLCPCGGELLFERIKEIKEGKHFYSVRSTCTSCGIGFRLLVNRREALSEKNEAVVFAILERESVDIWDGKYADLDFNKLKYWDFVWDGEEIVGVFMLYKGEIKHDGLLE